MSNLLIRRLGNLLCFEELGCRKLDTMDRNTATSFSLCEHWEEIMAIFIIFFVRFWEP